jgi:hypothetical protein
MSCGQNLGNSGVRALTVAPGIVVIGAVFLWNEGSRCSEILHSA